MNVEGLVEIVESLVAKCSDKQIGSFVAGVWL